MRLVCAERLITSDEVGLAHALDGHVIELQRGVDLRLVFLDLAVPQFNFFLGKLRQRFIILDQRVLTL